MPYQPRTSHGGENKKKRRRHKIIAWLTLTIFNTQPLLASAQVIADPHAGQNKPIVESTANGIPIVQITKPSAAGVSRNQYVQLNVNAQGLILNNATTMTKTQLAGYVERNLNLGNTPARVILNEVTSNNPSYLRGYTEVAGQKAEVIIANPNGIYGNGFGFINTSRATLTTGTPLFGGNGSLEAFRVTGGQIAIEGQGLDASSVDQVDLISRAATVNAGIWAKNLNVVTGTNQVDYHTRAIQKIAGNGSTPQVAIDVGALGGMYANKIFLIGTENGVGVNSKGTLAAAGGDITITNEGKVVLAGHTFAAGNMQIQAKDGVTNQGTLYTQNNASLTTQNTIDNTGTIMAGKNTVLTAQHITSIGTIGAGINTNGSIGSTGDLTLTAAGTVTTHGQNIAAGNMTVKAAALDLSGSNTYAGSNVKLTATAGNINHTGAALQTAGAFTATATGTIKNDKDAQGQAGDITAAHITLSADAISNRGGTMTQLGQQATNITANKTIDNSGGQIATKGQTLQMTAQAIDNSQGQIQHAGTGALTVQAAADLTNQGGQIASNGQIALTARNINNSQGRIITKQRVDLTAQGSFTNNQGLLAGDALKITTQGAIQNNQGSIEASKGLELAAQSLTNQGGSITSLDASGFTVAVVKDINNAAGLMGGNGHVNITAQNISSQGGQVSAKRNLNVTAKTTIDNGGTMIAGQHAVLTAQHITSTGTIGAGINANGSIGSTGDLTLTAAGTVTTHGHNLAAGNMSVKAAALDLSGSNTFAGGPVKLTASAGNIDHTGAVLETDGAFTAIATGAINNDKNAQGQAGDITAAHITLNANAISNRGGTMTQLGQQATNITATQTIDNRGGKIATNGETLQLTAQAIDNSQGQIQHAGTGALTVQAAADLTNSGGQIISNGQIALTAKNINNSQGNIITKQRVDLTAQGSFINNQGLLAGDALKITAQGAVANNQGSIEASKGLNISAQSLTNQGGSMTSLDASGFTVTIAQDINNAAGLMGGNGHVAITAQNISSQNGQVSARGNLNVTAQTSIDNGGTMLAGQHAVLTAQHITSTGTIGAGINANGSIGSTGDLTLTAAGMVTTHGHNLAAGNMTVKAASIDLSGSNTYAGGPVKLTATAGNIDHTGAVLETAGAFTAIATGAIKNDKNAQGQAGDITAAHITLSADAISNRGGTMTQLGQQATNISANKTIDNSGGTIATNGVTLQLTAQAINNSQGRIQHAGTGALTVQAAADLTNSGGQIISNGQIALTASNINNSQGSIITKQRVDLTAQGSFINNQGLLAGDALKITAQGAVANNQGSIEASKGLELAAQSLVNQSGSITSLDASGFTVAVAQDINNAAGLMGGNGHVNITAQNISSQNGQVSARGNLNITAKASIDNGGTMLAGQHAVLTAQNITSTGTIGAGINANGSIGSTGDLTLTAAGMVTTHGKNLAAGNMTVNATAIDLSGSNTFAGGPVKLTATAGNINHTGAALQTDGAFTAIATGAIKNDKNAQGQAGDITAAHITLSADAISNRGGTITQLGQQATNITATQTIDNSGGRIATNGETLQITAQAIDNSQGQIQHAGTGALTVQAAADLINSGGQIAGNGQIALKAKNINNSQGNIITKQRVDLTAQGSFINNQGLLAGDALKITAQGAVANNQGSIEAGKGLELAALSLTNQGGSITSLDASGFTVTIAQDIDNAAGLMGGNGHVNITAQNISSQGGQVSARGNLNITAQTSIDNGGTMIAGQHAILTAQHITSTGTIGAGINTDGSLGNVGDLTLTAAGMVTTHGQNLAAGNMTVKAASIDLSGSNTYAGGPVKLTATAGNINHTGAALQTAGAFTATATGAINNDKNAQGKAGDITAAHITLSADAISNRGSTITQLGQQATNITAKQTIDNSGGIIATNGETLQMTAQAINNSQGRIQHAGTGALTVQAAADLTNSGGQIISNGQIALTARNINNSQGNIITKQRVDLTAQGSFTNNQGLLAGDALKITAQGAVANNQGSIEASKGLNISAQSLTNQSGSITSLDASGFTVTVAQDINNTAGLIGGNGHVNITAQNISSQGGQVSARGNLNVTAQTSIDNGGTMLAGQHVVLTAQHITSTGTIGAGINTNGSIGSTGDLTLTAAGMVTTHGQNLAAGNMTVKAASIDLSGSSTYAGGPVKLTATAGNINHTGAALQTAGAFTATATGTINNDKNAQGKAGDITAARITLSADAISNRGGKITQLGQEATNITAKQTIDNSSGIIAANGATLQITAQAMNNSQGQIQHAGTGALTVQAAADLINSGGQITSNGRMELQGYNIDNSQGVIISQKDLMLTGQSLQNNKDIVAGGNVHLTVKKGAVDNTKGTLQAGKGLTMSAQALTNQNGSIINLDASSMKISVDEAINNAAGLIGGNGHVDMTGKMLKNQGGQVFAQGNLTITTPQGVDNTDGKLLALHDLTVNQSTANLNNMQGSMEAGNDLTVQATAIDNTDGTLAANRDVKLELQTLNGVGEALAGRTLDISLEGDYTNAVGNELKSNSSLELTTTGAITNQGTMTAVQNMTLNGTNIVNDTDATMAAGAIALSTPGDITNRGRIDGDTVTTTSQNFNNTGSVFGDIVTINADKVTNTDEAALIAATTQVGIYARTGLENKDGATIYSLGDIIIAGSKNLDRAGTVLNQSATIEADGNIDIFANQIINKKREFVLGQKTPPATTHSEAISSLPPSYTYEDWVGFKKEDIKVTYISGTRTYTETITETVVIKDSPEGKILAGGDMVLSADTVTNDLSWILARGTMAKANVNNIALPRTRIIKRKGTDTYTKEFRVSRHVSHDKVWHETETRDYSAEITEPLTAFKSLFGGGETVYIEAHEINNITVNPDGTPVSSTPISFSGQNTGIVQNANKETSLAQTVLYTPQLITEEKPDSIEGVQKEVSLGYAIAKTTQLIAEEKYDSIEGAKKEASLGHAIAKTPQLIAEGKYDSVEGVQKEVSLGHAIAKTSQLIAEEKHDSVKGAYKEVLLGKTIANNTPELPSGQNAGDLVVGSEKNSTGYFTLPNNGLFTIQKEPDAKYLVETDSRFTSYKNFLSSDYMFRKMSTDPERLHKRLGDGFYEQKLVRDQITELTGRRYLEGYASDEAQFKALMDNGLAYAREFNLKVGIALNAEQMAKLTTDVVWLVEQEVEGQKVLVPVVYLAKQHLDLTPQGALIIGDIVTITAIGDVTNSGTIKGNNAVYVSGNNVINEGGTIDGGAETILLAKQDIANLSGKIAGDQVILSAGQDIRIETLTLENKAGSYPTTIALATAGINAQDNLVMQAGRDINIKGGEITAAQNISIGAGRNLEINSVETKEYADFNNKYINMSHESTTNIVSTIQGGGNVNLAVGNDATLRGVLVSAGNDLNLAAGGNITVTAVKDRVLHEEKVGDNRNYKHTKTDDETVIGSNLVANGNVNISATQSADETSPDHGNVTIEGSNVYSETGKITIAADNDVTIKEASERHETFEESKEIKKHTFSKTTTITRDHTVANYAIGSALSGDQVQIRSGNDLTVQGSQVVGTNAVALLAANNVNITTAQETYDLESYFYQKTSGLTVSFSGGLNVFAGSTKQKNTSTEHTVNQVGSTIGSTNGNVIINAGKDAGFIGSDVIGKEGIDVTAQNITIDAAYNTTDSHETSVFKQTGLTISAGNKLTGAVGNAYSHYDRSQQVEDDRLQALYGLKTARDIKDTGRALDGIKADKIDISVGISSTTQKTETDTHTSTALGSSLTSDGNIRLHATGSGNQDTDGDLNITGSSVNGADVTLAAARDVNLKSSANTMESHTKSSGKSFGMGASSSGYYVEGNVSKGNTDETSTTYNETNITAKNTLTIESGRDTNFVGAQASGDTVIADIGGDLNLESQQDTQTYKERNKSAGAKISNSGGTASANKGKIDSNYQSVNEQTGIFAGTGGFDIEVEGNTDLKGAVIASEADAEKNKLSTGSLTFSDIENKAEYESSSKGASFSSEGKGVTPDLGGAATGDASSTTHSAVSAGTIEVRSNPNMDLANLSRDTKNAVNALDQIFDKKTVQEQQELSKMFGEEAFKAVGDLASSQRKKALDDAKNAPPNSEERKEALQRAESWEDGGVNKIALHAMVGGIMSDMGGSSFASGAVGAGVNESIQKQLAKINDPGLHQLASAVVGGAAAKAVGGNAQAGAATAASGTKNNWLNHVQQEAMADELEAAIKEEGKDSAKVKEILAYYTAMSQYQDQYVTSTDGKWEVIEEPLKKQLEKVGDLTDTGLNYNLTNLSAQRGLDTVVQENRNTFISTNDGSAPQLTTQSFSNSNRSFVVDKNQYPSLYTPTSTNTPSAIEDPIAKTADSLKEIGSDINSGLAARADVATESPYNFANYVTIGAVDSVNSGSQVRAEKMLDSNYDFANWASFGTVDMVTDTVKGALFPEDPLSKEHLMSSAGAATLVYGGIKPSGSTSLKVGGSATEAGVIYYDDLGTSTAAQKVAQSEAGAISTVNKAEKIVWPPNNGGVLGTEKNVVLQEGYQFDRYGKNSGSYVSPVDTPYEMRSLAPGTEFAPYKVFEVAKPVRGQGSVIAPWFDQPGGGIQFKLSNSIDELLESGRIKEVTK